MHRVVTPDGRYAVRSSADVEDGSERSFAGQFDTVLDTVGVEAVVDAVEHVLSGTDSASAKSYVSAHGASDSRVRMAVIVQEMVSAVRSGVAFSVNPVTGLSEIIIESVAGSGESLVQQGVTPERWIRKWGAWRALPESPLLPSDIADGIADDVHRIARRYGRPVDVEWVFDGETVTYVQLRPITGVGEIDYYSNKIAREQLPGMITPLVWSVNIPIVNGAWIRLLERLVGPTGLKPDDLAARFYGRAYYNMGALGVVFDLLGLPRESLELLMGMEKSDGARPRFRLTVKTLMRLPRVALFGVQLMGFERHVERQLSVLNAEFVDLMESVNPESDDAGSLVSALDSLRTIVEATAYLNVLTPLLSGVHNRMLTSRLSKLGVAYESVDFANRDPGSEGRDPASGIAALRLLRSDLTSEASLALTTGGIEALRDEESARAFVRAFDDFLRVYGHFSDSGNDFSRVPWREDPSAVLRLLEVPTPAKTSRKRVVRSELASMPGGRRILRAFDRASRFQVLRERVSSFYTLSYGYHRVLYRGLARLSGVDAVADSAILYLTDPEVRDLVVGRLDGESARRSIVERAAEEEAMRDAVVPETVFGDVPPPLQSDTEGRLEGVATSSGRYTGRAVKVSSVSEAPEIAAGDVIVVPYSDVAWTPLFGRAGAIVAEAGGFLSHSSIVARELGVPAVVSVNGAMQLIPDGALVTVDGYTGSVSVLKHDDRPVGATVERQESL